ncbi:metal-dependent hydrolase [Afifella pfennigii]|uniref:metal-dependent hydrolase n=1 Tax=Afifella pfennigii TaxID=209897 RepID=UPI00047D8526|nr:metal-dependent hydrolase [Afifella pfennigii]
MKITWLGHSAFRLDFADKAVMIDPFLSGSPVFEGGPLEAAKGATHVLLTHGHDDHTGDTVEICKATGAQLVSSFEVCMYLAGQGVDGNNVNPGNHGGTVDCGGFTVSFTDAVHSSSAMVDGRPVYLGNPMGLVVKAPGEKVLYHMGDTAIFGDMALVHEIHQPEIGIVPIGDRFTMGGDTAALACKRFFEFSAILPCHYRTFPIIDQTPDRFLAAMGEDAGKVHVPEVGETVEV